MGGCRKNSLWKATCYGPWEFRTDDSPQFMRCSPMIYTAIALAVSAFFQIFTYLYTMYNYIGIWYSARLKTYRWCAWLSNKRDSNKMWGWHEYQYSFAFRKLQTLKISPIRFAYSNKCEHYVVLTLRAFVCSSGVFLSTFQHEPDYMGRDTCSKLIPCAIKGHGMLQNTSLWVIRF